MRAAHLLVAFILTACSSPDFEAGHRERINWPAPANDNSVPDGSSAWQCVATWTPSGVWAKWLKSSRECRCLIHGPPVHLDKRVVYAPGPVEANVQWWVSWGLDGGNGPRHVIEGPTCSPIP